MPEGPEDVAFTATEIGVHLTGKKSVLGDVCSSGVVVQRQKEQPDGADDDAKKGEVGRELEDARIAPQREDRC